MSDTDTQVGENGYVYFIRAASGFIKIGYSIDPQRRLEELRKDCYEELTLIATQPGNISDENRFHKVLRDSHVMGEWFKPTNDVLLAVSLARPIDSNAVVVLMSHPSFPSSPSLPPPSLATEFHRRANPVTISLSEAIAMTNGHLGEAAKLVGVSRRTLQNEMRRLGLPPGKSGRRRKNLQP